MPAVRALWVVRKVYPKGVMVSQVNPDRAVGPAPGETILFFRRFTPADIAEVVSAGEVWLAGLTRFVFEERVLNVRYPLGLI